MARLGIVRDVVDATVVKRTARRLGAAGIVLPTFAELADPATIPAERRASLAMIDPDDAHPANLFRVHWHNGSDRWSIVDVPGHVVLPSSLTGVDATIAVAFGDRFPMIGAHKVLAAYGCLVPRLVTGEFDPATDRAVWPSTGNYCRGGVAISRILGCRGVAVLPEGMSQERFDWLDRWVAAPEDVIRTPGTESNVKEIYDRCKELELDPGVVVFNQFSEFGNHLVHELVTGRALARVVDHLRVSRPGLRVAAFVSATGSAGTIAAGDHLKERDGAQIVAVEALECPTLTENGFGEHNIQGIGDKHVPLIHNVMNTDAVVGDLRPRHRPAQRVVQHEGGPRLPRRSARRAARRRPGARLVRALEHLQRARCGPLCAQRRARAGRPDRHGRDGRRRHVRDRARQGRATRLWRLLRRHGGGRSLRGAAARRRGRPGAALTDQDRRRIFNLGYFTWVEQQGIELDAFVARRSQAYWKGLRELVPAWDELIRDFNARAAAG